MMSDSQNSGTANEESSATLDDDVSEEDSKPALKSYYYDDATGYEIYQEQSETDEDDRSGEPQTEQ